MNTNQTLELLSNLSANKDQIPIIIELAGTPNSGKTTLIEEVNTIFRRYGIKCQTICESAKYCKIKSKKTPPFNYWTALETIQRILSVIDQGYKIILCDRGIFDAMTWMRFYLNSNQISRHDYDTITNFYLMNEWKQYIQCIVLVTCDVESSIKRDIDYNEFVRYGTIVNPDTIEKINIAISETKEIYANEFNKIITYDTSFDIKNTKKQIMKELFDYLIFYMQ